MYVWLSPSLTVQSGLRVLRVAVPKYRHAGTGTIFCLLPTPFNLAYTSYCWRLARSQLKRGSLRTNYPGTRSVLPNYWKLIVHLHTKTDERNSWTEFSRTDRTSSHCKSLFFCPFSSWGFVANERPVLQKPKTKSPKQTPRWLKWFNISQEWC